MEPINYKEGYKKFFKEFLEDSKAIYMQRIREMIALNKRSLVFSHKHLFTFNKELASLIVRNPEEQIFHVESAIKELIAEEEEEYLAKVKRVFARIKELYFDDYKLKIRDIRANHLGCLIEIRGVVTKCSALKFKLVKASFYCENCGAIFDLDFSSQAIKKLELVKCISCGSKISRILNKDFLDVQKIIVQEPLEEVPSGQIPRTIEVYLEGDIVDIAYPGNHVTIVGILKEKRSGTQEDMTFSAYLHAINIEVKEKGFEEETLSEEDEQEILKLKEHHPNIGELIVNSIAPSIYGHQAIKKALALQLFGGVPKMMPDGTKRRGDIHVFLVGDPGTAKTQLLRYMAQIAPKGIYTSGKGVSAAGLTAAVVKDKATGEFYLEAGALVLADQGLAAIDEIDKMRSEDRAAMHEAMEQQTISIAKAGIVATLNARCAILAAANPALGRFEKNRTIVENIDLPPTLLSRFDLIFPIIDVPSKEEDSKLADHILAIHSSKDFEFKDILRPEQLRKYVVYARKNIHPRISKEAEQEIKNFFLKMREVYDETRQVAITTRQLEALIRLAEASARMNLREEATIEDAFEAISLMKYMMDQALIDVKTQKLDIDIIMTGISKSQRDRLSKFLDVLKRLNYDKEPVEIEEVISTAENEGIPRQEAEKMIKKMISEGDLYQPRQGYIKKSPA